MKLQVIENWIAMLPKIASTALLLTIVLLTSASQENTIFLKRGQSAIEIKELIIHLSRVSGKQYYLDPQVKGEVTIFGHLPQDGVLLLQMVEDILASRDLFIDKKSTIYQVLPRKKHTLHTEIVKLKYLSVGEIKSSLKLFADTVVLGGNLRGDVLILNDSKENIARIKFMVRKLDIPQRKIGIIKIKNRDAKTLLDTIVAGNLLPQIDYSINLVSGQNSLLLSSRPQYFQMLSSLIKDIDTKINQVLIEAVIAEMRQGLAQDIGSEWARYFNNGSSALGGVFPNNSSSPVGLSLRYGAIGSGDLYGIIRFLEERGGDAILSTPSIVTIDNQKASIVVGQNVPFVTGNYTPSTNDSGNPFQTIERQDIGITLTVLPKIINENTIRMELEQEVSNLSDIRGLVSDVVTNKRSIKTNIIASDGQLIILGGLIEKSEEEQRSQIPVLGDLPIIGNLFGHKHTEKVKKSLMVFIKPTIIRHTKQLKAKLPRLFSEEEDESIQ